MHTFYMKQGSEEWHRIKRGVPSASNFDRIVTPVRCELSKQADDYICQLLGELHSEFMPPNAESYTSKDIVWGREMEPEARRWYAAHSGFDVQQVGFCTTDDGRFGASPDGVIGEDGLLELKCPQPHTQMRYLLSGELPPEYRPQVHGQLIVTGRKWVDFASYCPLTLDQRQLLVRVTPDDYTEKLRQALEEFWCRYQELLSKIRSQT